MSDIKQFKCDVDVVIGRGDFNLNELHYVISGETLNIMDGEDKLKSFFGSQYDAIFEDVNVLSLVEEHFKNAQFNPFELDRREKAVANLSTEHPKVESVHSDIKALIPTACLVALDEHGFKDCSWPNDETPSYYRPSFDSSAIYVHDEVDSDGNRMSSNLTYAVFVDSEFVERFNDVHSAIERCKR
ncbi:hypothetical protein N9L75_03710 [Porticoccaceae bacterium]|nr:hypothetical protein [Porticoccaceae bacterium]MDA8651662.1 hypothetical protein [Porticoccaceae bacterium]MDB2664468.1 hypothetical protein [Porticoccaceae bacterium]